MMKFVSKLRMDYDLPATEYPCSVNADGEDRQVMVFANEELQRDLVVQNISVDKPAASTTEITQIMDQETFITYKNFRVCVIYTMDLSTHSQKGFETWLMLSLNIRQKCRLSLGRKHIKV